LHRDSSDDVQPASIGHSASKPTDDPEFEQRLKDVCGLYVDPPENVLVISLDEKTGIQAKAPTKPDMPAAPGKPPRREHEYTRNGTQPVRLSDRPSRTPLSG
jgi:hypothetical protein